MTKIDRETWLNLMAKKMAPRFEAMGFPLPKFRVSVGFCSGGKDSKANAEIWSDRVSNDGHHEIFIRPDSDDSVFVASLLCHELTHAAVGLAEGHTGKFAKVAMAFGLKRPMTATTPGPAFYTYVKPFVAELGDLPHARLNFRNLAGGSGIIGGVKIKARPGASTADHGEITSAPPKQGTRLIKAVCDECGYTVRVTAKWLEIGPPHCPIHGAMSSDPSDA